MKHLITALAFLFSFASFSNAQMRIISMMPSATENLFAVKAKKVIAVGTFCNYPKEVESLERVGDYYSPDIERILFLKPDLVVVQKTASDSAAARLTKMNIKVLTLENEKNIDGIYENISILGKETGSQKEAEKLIAKLKKAFAEIKAKSDKAANTPKVFIHVDLPYWTAGKNSYINSLVETAGGKNIFAGENREYFNASWEAIVKHNPDIILNLTPVETDYEDRPAADNINAVKNKKIIYPPNKDIIVRPSPRAVDGAKYLQKEFAK